MLKQITTLILLLSSISVSAQVTAQFTINNSGTEFCLNDTIIFTNTSTGDVIISYWDFGDGTDTWADNPKHVYKSTGQYTVSLIVYDDAGVSNSTSITLTLNQAPSVTIINNPIQQSLAAITNDANVTYQWFYNSTPTVETDSVVYYLESGNYAVVVSNLSGCSSSANYSVNLGDDSTSADTNEITVLNNILTPGIQDGANDVLFIQGLNYFSSACVVSVYNKWGQLVYFNNEYSNFGGFEGRDNKGGDLDAGTYLYVIKSAGKKTTTGYVDLIR
ncbi:MAG: gliding motility-associated C-terminal domain-containing protein [Bacteroidales bacterium]|nr:gliding motility-associated C-terminal domain-containing protein [Bacteroidales bacterium]